MLCTIECCRTRGAIFTKLSTSLNVCVADYRFACRIICDREAPYTTRIFAAGFDSRMNISLGVSCFFFFSIPLYCPCSSNRDIELSYCCLAAAVSAAAATTSFYCYCCYCYFHCDPAVTVNCEFIASSSSAWQKAVNFLLYLATTAASSGSSGGVDGRVIVNSTQVLNS